MENGDVEPNLHTADLRDADLRGIDFHKTNLTAADFSNADVRDADLSEAILYLARFRNANFSGTDFLGANLYEAYLHGANFSQAYFMEANLSGANLTNANFFGAHIADTVFGYVDLSQVRNLESVVHHGPSSIGIDTIYKSRGNIPEKFLCGCGIPEDFITYMRSLTRKGIEFYSCFISYSSKDEEFAKRLYNDLQSEGVRCWFAPEDLKIGEKFRVRIDESIRLYDKLLLVLSESSVASEWVEKEVETAFEKEREQGKTVLFPVRLDDAVLEAKTGWAADVRRSRHIGDFRDWKKHDSYRKAFERLMRDLKAEASR
jgi:hypothetical protein